ncbi:MAG: putative metal-binding motif-containing protein [Polyangiaceae bacterium]
MLLNRIVRLLRKACVGVACVGAIVVGCGRSSVPEGDGTHESACLSTADCANGNECETRACIQGFCRITATVTCDDDDPCTTDRCVPETGRCEAVPRTSDEDGDGHRASLLGTRPGELGSCGDDCDDSSAEARPGGEERCDGVDNDCNGIIDDGAAIRSTVVAGARFLFA